MDLIITEDGHVYIETKCKRDGIVKVDITDDLHMLFVHWKYKNSV